MFGIQRHILVQIGAKCEGLAPAFTFGVNLNRREGRIIDADARLFSRSHQPIVPVIFPPQYRGKQLNQRFAANWRAMIKPCTVMAYAHVDIAAELLTRLTAPLGCGGSGAQIVEGAADGG